MFPLPIFDPKNALRELGKNRRAEAVKKLPNAGAHAASHFMRHINPSKDKSVAVYFPVHAELDTWPLVKALAYQGNIICLPVVKNTKSPLTFRRYTVDAPLIDGTYNIKIPPESAPEVIPDIIVCPLLAWRKNGIRLGMGGGFYDRTLAKLRAERDILAIGYGYSLQEINAISADKHDEPMDWIVTEQTAIKV